MPREYVDQQNYFPAAKVRLLLRFDEGGATNTPQPPATPPQLRSGQSNATGLNVISKDGRLVLERTEQKDLREFPIELIPRSVTIERNGVRVADTASVELRYADFPFDPRVVRSCGIQIYLGTLTPEQFRNRTSDGSNILPDEWQDARGRTRSNLRFTGWADEFRLEMSGDGEPFATFECTDNTRLLIDQEVPPKLQLNREKEIDQAIAEYLAYFPQFAGLEVEYRPKGQTKPVLGALLSPIAGGKPKSAAGGKQGPPPEGAGAGGKTMVWDYLTDVCAAIGLMIRVEGVRVVIQTPRTLYASNFPGREDDPFTGRTLPGGRIIRGRTMVWGTNILSLNFAKKFTHTVSRNIEVRCYSPSQKKTIIARYPEMGSQISKINSGGGTDTQWLVKQVRGIEDEKTLRAVAQAYYETANRTELEATVSTHNLCSLGGSALDPDLLDAEAGDLVQLEIPAPAGGPSPGGTDDANQAARASRAADYLTELGYEAKTAQAYADAAAEIVTATNFRVRTNSIGWRDGEGLEITLNVVNYVEARVDRTLPEGEEPQPEPGAEQTQPIVVVPQTDA